jgi:hypothetical protein
LVNLFGAMSLKGEAIVDWFACGLDTKICVGLTNAVPLSIDGADGDAKLIGIDSAKLWNVVGDGSGGVYARFRIQGLELAAKVGETRDDELTPEGSFDKEYVGANDFAELFVGQSSVFGKLSESLYGLFNALVVQLKPGLLERGF